MGGVLRLAPSAVVAPGLEATRGRRGRRGLAERGAGAGHLAQRWAAVGAEPGTGGAHDGEQGRRGPAGSPGDRPKGDRCARAVSGRTGGRARAGGGGHDRDVDNDQGRVAL
eukprot:7363152-Pyramimonas_sp.AAC.1